MRILPKTVFLWATTEACPIPPKHTLLLIPSARKVHAQSTGFLLGQDECNLVVIHTRVWRTDGTISPPESLGVCLCEGRVWMMGHQGDRWASLASPTDFHVSSSVVLRMVLSSAFVFGGSLKSAVFAEWGGALGGTSGTQVSTAAFDCRSWMVGGPAGTD